MALPSPLYIAFQGLETYFVNKDTGLPLSGGLVKFFKDVARSVPKDVFQQVQLPDDSYSFVNIGSENRLTAVGTFASPNDGTDIQVYAYPYDTNGDIELYYLEIYNADGVLQFTREAQPANAVNDANEETFVDSENQIENPQFVIALLGNALTQTFTVTGSATETEIAPDWSIITNGSGTVTVTQTPLIDISMPTGAPFAIRISSTGITSIKLRQQITQSPRILGQGFIYGSFVAKTFTRAAILLSMDYVASDAYTVNLVTQSTSADGNWETLGNDTSTPIVTTNADSPNTPGYVNIDITIPVLSDVGITSVQVISTKDGNSTSEFIQESVPRQIDHLFHYYKPELEYKPIPSYLTAWDFPLNPCQALGPTVGPVVLGGTNLSRYIADQTIIFSSVDNSVGMAKISRGFNFSTAVDSSFAIIQYLSAPVAIELLSNRLSVEVQGISTSTIPCEINLYWTADVTLPTITTPTFLSLLSGVNSTAVQTVGHGTWNKISRSNGQGDARFNLIPSSDATYPTYSFNSWDATQAAGITTATYFAMIVSFGTLVVANQVVLNHVSLCAGDIATRPAPQTPDEVLRECQYYYQKSFLVGTIPAQNVGLSTGEYNGLQNVTESTVSAIGPLVQFRVPMIHTPAITLYNPAAANAQIRNETRSTDYSVSAPGGLSANGFYTSGTSPAGSALGDFVCVHWTANARLGTY